MDGVQGAQAELDRLAERLDALYETVHHDFRVRPDRRRSRSSTWSVDRVHPLVLDAARALARGRGEQAVRLLSSAAGTAIAEWPQTPVRDELVDLAADVERHVERREGALLLPSRPPAAEGLRWDARADLAFLAWGLAGTSLAVGLLVVWPGTSNRGVSIGLAALPVALLAVGLSARQLQRRRRAWGREVAALRSAPEDEVVVVRDVPREEMRALGDRLQRAFDWAATELADPVAAHSSGVPQGSLQRVCAQVRTAAGAMGSDDLARVVRLLDATAREVSDSWPHCALATEVLGCAQQARRTAGL